MKRYIKILSIFSFIMVLSSCDSLLEEANPNGVSTDIFWSNLDETETALTGVYSSLLSYWMHSVGVEALRADLAFPRNRKNPTGQGVLYYQQTFLNSSRDVQNKWAACYQSVFRANQLIEGLENLGSSSDSTDQARWTTQMAQARFVRGLAHFYLHSTYNNGDVIIHRAVPKTNEDFNKPLSPSSEVLAFFREDFKYAYENLPAQYSESEKGRVTKGAAAMLLGKSHLYEGEYTEAMVYFNDVINNAEYGYQLVTDMDLMFTAAGEFNSESIFEINYTVGVQIEDSQWDEESFNSRLARFTAPNNKGGAGADHFLPSAWLSYEYANEPLDTLDSRNWVDDGMGGLRKRNVSLRASAMIALVQDEDTEYYLEPSVPIACSFTNYAPGYFKKYSNHDIVSHEKEVGATPWKSGRNLIVNRLSEVYLMLAECQIQTGDITGALANINTIRQRWGLRLLGPNDGSNHVFDEVNYTAQTLMEHLMYIEKPLEVSTEGHSGRQIDLRRWGILKQRFDELAAMEFYVDDYTYTKADGSTAKRNNCWLMKGTSPDPDASPIISEYTEASANFIEELHAYLPIPLNEIQNNSSID